MASPKVVSFGIELDELRLAVEAARLLASAVVEGQLGSEEEDLQAKRALAGALGLVSARMDALRSVVRGNRDPATVWTPQNATSRKPALHEDEDVRLAAWLMPNRRKPPRRRRSRAE